MAKISRDETVRAALELLDEVGLDALSTRRLAQKLGVESAALYWHFKDKSVLLGDMAARVMSRHHTLTVPDGVDAWPTWLADNARSFRQALLAHRDGARLHAGAIPAGGDLERVRRKVDYLSRAGFSEAHAGMALFASGQFTLGCVLEEQAQRQAAASPTQPAVPCEPTIDHAAAFEFGLEVFVDGLKSRTPRTR